MPVYKYVRKLKNTTFHQKTKKNQTGNNNQNPVYSLSMVGPISLNCASFPR